MSDAKQDDFFAFSTILDQEPEFIPLISVEEEDHLNSENVP